MGHAASWSYTVTLSPRASNVAVARGLIRECLIEHDLPSLVEDIGLVTSELATNAVVHAATPFTVRLEELADGVWLTVSDDSEHKPVAGSESLMSTGGRGLPIVDSYARSWGVINGKRNAKSVWASFDTG